MYFNPLKCRNINTLLFAGWTEKNRNPNGTSKGLSRHISSYLLILHNPTKELILCWSDCFVQVTMEFGLDRRTQTLQGLAFPLQEDAKRALQQLKQKRINYIQLVSLKRQKPLCNQWVVLVQMIILILVICCNAGTWLILSEFACLCCAPEAGCGKRDDWVGSHQTHRNPRASLQDSYRFSSISLLHLQAFPSRPDSGGAGSVCSLLCLGNMQINKYTVNKNNR